MLRHLLLALLILSVTPLSLLGQRQFASAPNFPAGASPAVLASGDFNGDGITDLAVVSKSQAIQIMLGNGDGTFRTGQTLQNTPTGSVSVVIGNFTGSGKLDLINGCGPTLNLYRGNGDGTFQSPTNLAAPQYACVVAAADVNGDHKSDLILAANPSGVVVLLGNGDGTFQAPITSATDVSAALLITADFNHDKKVDLAIADPNSNKVSVLLGNGDGTFTTATDLAVASNPVSLAAEDLNNDGNEDLVVLEGRPDFQFSVFLGHGDGTFTAGQSFPAFGAYITIADLNNDGKMDLILADQYAASVGLFLGNGDGTFQPQLVFPVDGSPVFVATGDFNGDHRTDLVTANNTSNDITVLIGDGNANFAASRIFLTPSSLFSGGIAVADFANHGKLDIASPGVPGTQGVFLLRGNGDGTFQAPIQISSLNSQFLAAGDFNRDGNMDLAVQTPQGISLLLGNGNGTFQSPIVAASGSLFSHITAIDLRRDGKLDLVVALAETSQIAVVLGNGDGTFQPPAYLAVSGDLPCCTPIDIADFNGDGKLDLAVVSNFPSEMVNIFLGNGDGTFRSGGTFPASPSATQPVAGDFNNDGRMDLVLGGFGSYLFLGNGDGTFQAGHYLDSSQIMLSADFNLDGNADLVGLTNVGKVRALMGTGKGKFSGPTLDSLATGVVVVAADVNGDGRLDLLVPTPVGINVLLNTSAVLLSPSSVIFPAQVLNTTSSSRTVMLTNHGATNWTVTGVSASGDFAVKSTSCMPTVLAGHSCNVITTFTPTAAGQRLGAITLVDTAPGSPQIVSLSGSGSIASVQPSSINFGKVPVNTMSQPKPVTLKNVSSTTTLNISSISVGGKNSGDFSQANNCGSSLGPQQSCTINVTFKPTAVGARSGTLQINDDTAGSPQKVSLAGTGT